MTNKQVHKYYVSGKSDWHMCSGRGWVVTVNAPFTRHYTGDVVRITTSLPPYPTPFAADYWFVLGVEGTMKGTTTGLCVRPATQAEIKAAISESLPRDDEEPGVAEARVLIARALRLLGEPDSHRAVVETLCVARDALGRGRDAA